MAMDQYLLIQFIRGWTSICHLFWCSPGLHGFDPFPNHHYLCLNHHLLPRKIRRQPPSSIRNVRIQDDAVNVARLHHNCHLLWETWGYKATKYIQIYPNMGVSWGDHQIYSQPIRWSSLGLTYTSYLRSQKHMGKTWEKSLKNSGSTPPDIMPWVWDLLSHLPWDHQVVYFSALLWMSLSTAPRSGPHHCGSRETTMDWDHKYGAFKNGGMGFKDVKLCKANLWLFSSFQ